MKCWFVSSIDFFFYFFVLQFHDLSTGSKSKRIGFIHKSLAISFPFYLIKWRKINWITNEKNRSILIMCYVVITCRSLAWFLITLVCDLFILTSMVTPKWLIGPQIIQIETFENTTMPRSPSVGINTRWA